MNSRQFSQRIGNIEDRLVQQSCQTPNYGRQRRGRLFRRLISLAAVIALMAGSFTMGAMASDTKKQETVVLEGIGLTLILPDSWKGNYGVEMDQDAASCAIYVKSIHDGDGEWAGGGYLFWVCKDYDEPMTPEEVEAISPVPCRYLFSTMEGTYILAYASDVQYDPNDPTQEQAYLTMQRQISDIRFLVDNLL